MKHHHARGPEETVCDLPPVVPAEPREWDAANMPAGSRNARPRASRRRKPVGAAGTQATPSPGGSTNARRRPNPRQNHCGYPPPLNQLPWGLAKDQFGSQRADFIGVMGALIVRSAKDQFRAYPIDSTRLSGTLPLPSRKTSPSLGHTEPAGNHATGVSPTRPAMGTPARPPAAPAAAPDGVAG